jgi:hypothetical protein
VIGEQAHQRRVAVLGGDIEGGRADITEKMPSETDVRGIAGGPAFLAERRLAPVDACVRIGALFQQLLRQLQRGDFAGLLRRSLRRPADAGGAICTRLAQPGDGVERRAARVRQVGVGAAIEQQRRELEVGVDRRHAECARAVRSHVVDVGALLQQQLGRFDMCVADRKEQWREAAGRFPLQIGPRFEQHRRCCRIPFGRGPHQRRLPLVRFDGVDLRTARQEQPHRIGPACQRRRHQHRLAFVGSAIGIRAGVEEPLHDGGVAVERGQI